MITAEDTIIKMTEENFGVALPIEISVEQLTADDVFSIKIFKSINTEPLIIKEYSNIKDNIIKFLEENVKQFLHILGRGRDFLNKI